MSAGGQIGTGIDYEIVSSLAQPCRRGCAASTSCHIEVAATGAYFVVDVGIIEWSDECHHVELADNSQATIAVDFTGP